METGFHHLGSRIAQVQTQIDTSARSGHGALASIRSVAVKGSAAMLTGIALGLVAELALLLR
jgi:hypothetical protein